MIVRPRRALWPRPEIDYDGCQSFGTNKRFRRESVSFGSPIQCDQIWRNFTALIKNLEIFGLFGIWQSYEPTLG